MHQAYINRIGTAVPPHDIHDKFVSAAPSFLASERDRRIFARLVRKSQIAHRYSFLEPDEDPDRIDRAGFFRPHAFPSVARRMRFYEAYAPGLAMQAIDDMWNGEDSSGHCITHLVVASCTGFSAPGLDLALARQLGLASDVERTVVGFMGCQAAINALKLADYIVRATPGARVLVVALELCTLHLQEKDDLEALLAFLIFGDGCGAALVTGEPSGIALNAFRCARLPDLNELITWHIRDDAFEMHLSGEVPGALCAALRRAPETVLPRGGTSAAATDHWALHPGGRAVLDAVREGLGLSEEKLAASRSVLLNHGNMSSPTVLFVLKALMRQPERKGHGCALAFGPGLSVESLAFEFDG